MTQLTLPIVIGKRYLRRDGQIVTAEDCPDDGEELVWAGGREQDSTVYTNTGRVYGANGPDYPHDLIADAPDEDEAS